MRFEMHFAGTLWQFDNVVRDLREKIVDDSGYVLIDRLAYEHRYTQGDPMVLAWFFNPHDQDSAKQGTIKATSLPGEKTLLQVSAPDEHWEELKPYWERLEDVMRRYGFIDGAEGEKLTASDYHGPVAETRPDSDEESDNDSTGIPSKEKRGRSKYTEEDKRLSVEEWGAKDPRGNTELLYDFLERKFGSHYGVPNVAESTFHGWQRDFK